MLEENINEVNLFQYMKWKNETTWTNKSNNIIRHFIEGNYYNPWKAGVSSQGLGKSFGKHWILFNRNKTLHTFQKVIITILSIETTDHACGRLFKNFLFVYTYICN